MNVNRCFYVTLCMGTLMGGTAGCADSANLNVSSTAFEPGKRIPEKYTCNGENLSPPLQVNGIPENTESMVVICDDPDAPAGTWLHWTVFNLPVSAFPLEEGIGTINDLPEGSVEGINDFKRVQYGGPCPPPGTSHRYFFRVYALNKKLDLHEGIRRKELEDSMKGHILAEGQLMGTFGR